MQNSAKMYSLVKHTFHFQDTSFKETELTDSTTVNTIATTRPPSILICDATLNPSMKCQKGTAAVSVASTPQPQIH